MRRNVQWREQVRRATVDVRLVMEQDFDASIMIALRRHVERSESVFGHRRNVGTGVNQNRRDAKMAGPCRAVERDQSVARFCVDICISIQK